jgi:GNAT superfamily N-acetyltransferase
MLGRMELMRPASVTEFLQYGTSFLSEHEAQHGLMLGVAIATRPSAPVYCALVLANGNVVAAGLRTNTRLIVSREGRGGAMALIAADAHHPGCDAVLGPIAAVDAFVAGSQLPWSRGMTQGIYESRRVVGAPRAHGRFRQAQSNDRDLLAHWSRRLHAEALSEEISLESAIARVDGHIDRGDMHVWEVEGRLVSVAAAVAPTPHGIRINNVYTPPEERGRGYASALVAALTQAVLDGGREFAFLHTDLANPTSNAIYKRLGYELVGDFQVYSLTATALIQGRQASPRRT